MKTRLRIGFEAKRAFTNTTGLGNYARFVIANFAANYPNHHLYLFTPRVDVAFANQLQHFSNCTIVTPDSFISQKAPSYWRSFLLPALASDLQLDVLHGLSNELPFTISQFGGKKIVTIHDLIFLRYPAYYNFIDRKIYSVKFKQACQKADVIIATSVQTKIDIQTYLGIHPDKIKVVYQNCAEQFAVKITEQEKKLIREKYNLPEKYIVCVGTIEQRKNQLQVLQAYIQAKPSDDLVFVGRQTAYANELHQLLSKHNLQKRVHFISNAAFAHFPAFYQMASKAVYASSFEGFGIPVLESLRSGVATIVAYNSSLLEVGGDVVHYFDAGNIEQLAELLKQPLPNFAPEKINLHLEQFSTPHLMNQLLEIYKG